MSTKHIAFALLSLSLAACAEPPRIGSRSSAATSYKVAGIQYAPGQASSVLASCSSAAKPDGCAVQELINQAKQGGAVLAVVPEHGLDQSTQEPTPNVGDNPGTDASWPSSAPYIKMFSQQAKQLGMTIVIHLLTKSSTSKPYSAQVALGPDGSVLATHYKFELFSSEKDAYTGGTDVHVFESVELGTVGLLICADIYGDLNLHKKLKDDLKARVIAFSSEWTAAGAANFQQSYARNWGVWFVGSNWSSGTGKGAGIFDPDGKELARVETSSPSVLMAEIPAP
jgi:predicted amidohydrolase